MAHGVLWHLAPNATSRTVVGNATWNAFSEAHLLNNVVAASIDQARPSWELFLRHEITRCKSLPNDES